MSQEKFKKMLGILGNYRISDRIYMAIDRERKGHIIMEDYLVYNEVLSHGSQTEKNFLSFRIIDSKGRSRVNF